MTDEIITQSPWSLQELYSELGGEDVQAAFGDIQQQVEAFEQYRDVLAADMPVDEFLKIIGELEAIQEEAVRLHAFAGLSFAADTQNQEAQTFVARVDEFLANAQNRILFFELWWKSLGEEAAKRFMDQAGDYHYWLEEMRHFKPHTLSEPEEKIINIKNVTGSNAFNNLYDAITNRYVFHVTIDGQEKELTRGELMVFARSSKPGLRKAAYQELYRVYGEDSSILGQIYQTQVRDWSNEQLGLRHFDSPIAARNLANDIPDAVVDTLLDVSETNSLLFQRFFRLKARLLGMDKLRRYDIYAPIEASDKNYEFDEAVGMVMESFRNFSPQVADLARRVLTSGHVDSEVRKGKRGGAFCWTVTPDLTPYVLLNYQGKADDVATMAHELGHAIHSLLASHHSLFTLHASLPLAETASTFGEMLLVDRLLAQESDETVRRELLFRQVDDAYATIMRQAYFAIFERTAHQMVKEGASVNDMAAAYLENLRRQFGDAVELSDEFRWEWVSIPHIYHVPFYVYAYAFGQLLVFSLYKQYQEEGESFKPRYLEILSAGGSLSPKDILSRAGIDMYDARFWQGGFDVIKDLVDELEQVSPEA